MTIKANTAEGVSGATDGLAMTSSLTAGGGDQLTISGTASRWTLKSGGMHGTYSYRVARGSGENPVMYYSMTTNQGSQSFYFKLSALPTADSCIAVFSNAGGFIAFAYVLTTGAVKIYGASSSVVGTSSAGLVSAGVWYRLDMGVIVGTTTSNGTIRAAVGLRDRTTTLYSVTSTAANTGTAALSSWQFGAPVSSTTSSINIDFDDIRLDDSTSTLIGAHGYTAASSFGFGYVLANPGGLTATSDFVADTKDNNASTGVTSPGLTTNETIEYGFDPVSSGSFTGNVKSLWVDGANSMRCTLRQGSTPTTPGTSIKTQLYTLTNTEASYTFANSGPENASVTDWNDLSFQVSYNAT